MFPPFTKSGLFMIFCKINLFDDQAAASFITGLLASGIASFLFLYYVLFFMRPCIKISTTIARYKNMIPESNIEWGEQVYYIKIVNKSWHAAYDVKLRLSELIRIPAGNGKMHERRKVLRLHRDALWHIPRHKNGKGNTFAPHAVVSLILVDILTILQDDNKCVEVQVILRHGLTGLSKVFTQEFGDVTSIKNGMFKFGDNLTV